MHTPQSLSIVIPTIGRLDLLVRTLTSLSACIGMAGVLRVLVLDNSAEGEVAVRLPKEMVTALPNLQTIRVSAPGLHEGRHAGVAATRSPWIAFLDDDVELSRHWLDGVLGVMNSGAAAGTGPIRPTWLGDIPDWMPLAASAPVYPFLSLIDLGSGSFPVRDALVFGANMVVSRRLLLAVGGFHPDGFPTHMDIWRGDGETGLMQKITAQGGVARYDSRMAVRHLIPESRVTDEALIRRSYIGGVSASFAELRQQHGLFAFGPRGRLTRFYARTAQSVAMHRSADRLLSGFLGKLHRRFSTPRSLVHEFHHAFARGWQEHHARFEADPTLRAHVLRRSWLAEGD
jgi:hypothetical protein